jgi:hypothetical protein
VKSVIKPGGVSQFGPGGIVAPSAPRVTTRCKCGSMPRCKRSTISAYDAPSQITHTVLPTAAPFCIVCPLLLHLLYLPTHGVSPNLASHSPKHVSHSVLLVQYTQLAAETIPPTSISLKGNRCREPRAYSPRGSQRQADVLVSSERGRCRPRRLSEKASVA